MIRTLSCTSPVSNASTGLRLAVALGPLLALAPGTLLARQVSAVAQEAPAASREAPAAAQEAPAAAQEAPAITIGLVVDGPWERNAELLELFVGEIEDLVREDFGAWIRPDRVLVGDWTTETVGRALDRLLGDPEVDMVLALGAIASHLVAQRRDLPKPVFAPVIIDAELQGLPAAGNKSGVPNLNYLAIPLTFELDVEAFLEITPFRRLAVLASGAVVEAIPEATSRIPGLAERLGIEVDVIPVTSAEAALAALPEDTEAVYLAPLHAWAPGELDLLAQALIDRRLPSFARMDEREIRRGFLATRTPESFLPRLARRLALNIQNTLLGTDPGEVTTAFSVPERLTINMATARAIRTFPPWKVITEAVLINDQVRQVERTVGLPDVVREAVEVNLDLAARQRAVAAGREEVKRATSRLLPQVEVSALGVSIDRDRAEASFGSQAQQTLSGTATLDQIIFSERAWADLSVQRSLQGAREFERDADKLDIAFLAATAYLNVLRAKTLERIQRENLALTRSNLENARIRVQIGAANRSEVYRWESELAAIRQDVIDASAIRNVAEIELNRLLHRPLEERFATADVDLEDPHLLAVAGLYAYMENQWSFRVFRGFLVEEARRNAPELRALQSAIDAQSRVLSSTQTAFWAPTVALQADLTGNLGRWGAGSGGTGSLPGDLGGLLTERDDLDWSVALVASLPVFQGGARLAETRQASAELGQLEIEREAADERIEQRVRSSLHEAAASFANIDLSRDAADAARNGFELVQESYAEGVLSILDLLDAQNTYLVSELAAANAVYDWLIDLMRVERAVGRFHFFTTPAEDIAFNQRLDAYFEENLP